MCLPAKSGGCLNQRQMKVIRYMFLLTCIIVGCKKDDFKLDYSGIKPIILVPNTNWPGQSLYGAQPQDSVFGVKKLNLYARVSYAVPLDHAVKVSFKADPDLIDAYNSKYGTSYAALPANAYQAATLDLTIPAGVQQTSIPVVLFPDKIAGTTDYLIAFTVASAEGQTIAANAKSIIFTLKGQ
jgi:hypothetical protein